MKGGSTIETATVFDRPSPEDLEVGVGAMAAGAIVGTSSVTVGELSAAGVMGDERAVAVDIMVAATSGPPVAVAVLPGPARWSV